MKNKKLSLVSYTFATLAGVCFVGGILIAGGILMSVSLLFGGLAFTVITLKSEEVEKEKENEYEQKYIE